MKLIYIKPSTNKDKKLMAKFEKDNGRTITTHFGQASAMDYTKYYKRDPRIAEQKKDAYIARHKVTEDWNNPTKPGALSRWILWELPTIEASITKFKKRFNL